MIQSKKTVIDSRNNLKSHDNNTVYTLNITNGTKLSENSALDNSNGKIFDYNALNLEERNDTNIKVLSNTFKSEEKTEDFRIPGTKSEITFNLNESEDLEDTSDTQTEIVRNKNTNNDNISEFTHAIENNKNETNFQKELPENSNSESLIKEPPHNKIFVQKSSSEK